MYDTIVVPLDGTEHAEVAIHPAVAIAAQAHARVVFMSVADHAHQLRGSDYLSGRQRAQFMFMDCGAELLVDVPVAEGIIQVANGYAPSLVCMTSHGRGPLGQALFGSTSTHVIHNIGAPVLVAGPHCIDVGSYSEVVIAVDDSKESAAIVPAAVALADRIDAKLQIVQVIDNADLRRAREAGINPADLRESGHVAQLAARLRRDGIIAGWEVLHDRDPAHGIVDYMREKRSAIVAMATHARSGLGLLAHHGVATHVVHRSANPVLLLH
jgi:nucleotide-binding universal stress UspA family protein